MLFLERGRIPGRSASWADAVFWRASGGPSAAAGSGASTGLGTAVAPVASTGPGPAAAALGASPGPGPAAAPPGASTGQAPAVGLVGSTSPGAAAVVCVASAVSSFPLLSQATVRRAFKTPRYLEVELDRFLPDSHPGREQRPNWCPRDMAGATEMRKRKPGRGAGRHWSSWTQKTPRQPKKTPLHGETERRRNRDCRKPWKTAADPEEPNERAATLQEKRGFSRYGVRDKGNRAGGGRYEKGQERDNKKGTARGALGGREGKKGGTTRGALGRKEDRWESEKEKTANRGIYGYVNPENRPKGKTGKR
ncbi:hypothetical protein NDU88_001606 [Pleurodeles waltl]|uniref:Uncharacterized protein n=1 Tax=Pleurodeles waltl TaxID=8319 RepID=A0AAV7V8Y5_PLEWA|nr:hypothetical protein NDU88_001606 [Pleurodeles waltl]